MLPGFRRNFSWLSRFFSYAAFSRLFAGISSAGSGSVARTGSQKVHPRFSDPKNRSCYVQRRGGNFTVLAVLSVVFRSQLEKSITFMFNSAAVTLLLAILSVVFRSQLESGQQRSRASCRAKRVRCLYAAAAYGILVLDRLVGFNLRSRGSLSK